MMTHILGLSLLLAAENSRALGAEHLFAIAKENNGDQKGGLLSLAVSKEGNFFATSSEDYVISIRDKRGQIMATHTVHNEVDPILWTKRGHSLATLLPAFLTGNSWLILLR